MIRKGLHLATRLPLVPRWLLWRAQCVRNPEGMAIYDLPGGLRFRYPRKSLIGRTLALGRFEPGELEFCRAAVRPGDDVLDLGANAGFFAIHFAQWVQPSGRVIAVEPSRREAGLLQANLRLNHLENVIHVAAAVSDAPGEVRFAIAADGAMNSLAANRHPDQVIEAWETVRAVTLDMLVAELGLNSVAFIKLDVEGAEEKALVGGASLLSRDDAPIILFEASDLTAAGFASDARRVLALLREYGYQAAAFDGSRIVPVSRVAAQRLGTEVYNFVAWKAAHRSRVPPALLEGAP